MGYGDQGDVGMAKESERWAANKVTSSIRTPPQIAFSFSRIGLRYLLISQEMPVLCRIRFREQRVILSNLRSRAAIHHIYVSPYLASSAL